MDTSVGRLRGESDSVEAKGRGEVRPWCTGLLRSDNTAFFDEKVCVGTQNECARVCENAEKRKKGSSV